MCDQDKRTLAMNLLASYNTVNKSNQNYKQTYKITAPKPTQFT